MLHGLTQIWLNFCFDLFQHVFGSHGRTFAAGAPQGSGGGRVQQVSLMGLLMGLPTPHALRLVFDHLPGEPCTSKVKVLHRWVDDPFRPRDFENIKKS